MDASRVNDDYCDCEDGSDEPGTSACSAVSRTFYCVNKGHRGKSIFASRVNDGICDCCDGSDEFASRAGCTNTCAEAAAEFAQRNAALLRTFEAGARARAERVATAASIYAKLQEQVSEAEARLPDAEARVEALKAEVEDVRLAAEKELASRVALLRVELASKLRVTQLNTAQMQQLIIELVLETDGVTPLRNVERATDVFLGPAPKAVEVSAEGEVAEEGAGEAGEAGEAEASTDTAGDADAGVAGEGGEAESSEVGRLIARIKRESAADNDEAVKEKQAEVAAAEEEVVRVKGDAADAAAALALDFGPDQAFLPLKGECISANFGQYKYEVCPFGKAKQDYTSLGSFEGWDEGHSAMRFTGGQRCWNGPERSALVRVHCGSEDRLTRVDEPSTCTYELDLETPSACDSAGAARMGL